MVDVGYLEGSVSMARRTLFQLPIERLMGISGAVASPFLDLLGTGAIVNSKGEGLIARSGYMLAVAGEFEHRPRRITSVRGKVGSPPAIYCP